MTTIINPIIVPVSSGPDTRTRTFQVETSAGRVATVTVEAANELAPELVLSDLHRTDFTRLTPITETPDTPLGDAGIAAGLMAFLWLAGFILMFVLEMAGLVSMSSRGRNAVFWPSWLPVVGDTFLWTGMLRLWLIGFVVVPVVTYFVSRRKP